VCFALFGSAACVECVAVLLLTCLYCFWVENDNMQQLDVSLQVLEELGVQDLPLVTAWNKIDACPDPAAVRALAASRSDTVAISGASGEGLAELMAAISGKLAESMVEMEVGCLVTGSIQLSDMCYEQSQGVMASWCMLLWCWGVSETQLPSAQLMGRACGSSWR
jgi:hypothetical protein